jgi:hypothetical protein
MGRIVFTLNNTGIHHEHCTMVFTAFELLLSNKHSFVHVYVNKVGYFTLEDFARLQLSISIAKEKMVKMNLTQVIIFYTVIHFVCKSLVDANEEAILLSAFGEKEEGFNEVRDKILKFGKIATVVLRNHFTKNVRFNNAVKNIIEQ